MNIIIILIILLIVIVLIKNNNNKAPSQKSNDIIYVTKYFSPECGYCKRLEPHWVKLEKHYSQDSNVVINEINVNSNRSLANKEGISGVPTIILYKGGDSVKYTYPKNEYAYLVAFVEENK